MLLPRMTSVRELQRNYRQLAALVKKTNKPLIIMKNNKPDVVLITLKRLEAQDKIRERLEELETLEVIRKGEEEFRQGKAKLLRGSLADLISK